MPCCAESIANARTSIREGAKISQPLAASGLFPAMVTHMIDVGEETGRLSEMLCKVADFYDDEVDAMVKGLTSLIEPMLIVFMGVLVGFHRHLGHVADLQTGQFDPLKPRPVPAHCGRGRTGQEGFHAWQRQQAPPASPGGWNGPERRGPGRMDDEARAKRLLTEYQAGGPGAAAAREALVLQFRPLVQKQARQFFTSQRPPGRSGSGRLPGPDARH